MILRKQQVETFSRESVQRFVQRAARYLRDAHPDRTGELSDDAIQRLVQVGMRRSAQYGINQEPDIVGYLEFMLRLGHEFDTSRRTRWAAEILNQRSLGAPAKIAGIERRLRAGKADA